MRERPDFARAVALARTARGGRASRNPLLFCAVLLIGLHGAAGVASLGAAVDVPSARSTREVDAMNTARHVLNCLALLPALACVHNADGQLPAVSPVFTMSLPGFPGADGHDAVAACGDDIVYVRFSDRSVRLLRQNAEGSWNESAFPNQGSAVGTDFTRVYGSGDLLAVVYNRVNASRAEIHRRSPKGSWSLVQTISAPTSSTFVNLHQAVWSGTSLMLVDRYADSYRGAAFIFQQNQLGQWVQEAKLQGSAAIAASKLRLGGPGRVSHRFLPC